MAWTAPRTWVSGELVTAALMNSAVRDNLLAIDTFIGGRDLTASRILIGAGTSAITDTGDATLNGDLTVSGTGPHVFGGAVDSQSQVRIRGTFAERTGLTVNPTLTPPADGSAAHAQISGGTITEAGSGTHPDFIGLQVQQPSITGAGAALTNATSLKVDGAPSGATNNRALWVAGGESEFDGAVDCDSTLDVSGATELDSTLDVTGAAVLDSTLTVAGRTLCGTGVTTSDGIFAAATTSNHVAIFESVRDDDNGCTVNLRHASASPGNGDNPGRIHVHARNSNAAFCTTNRIDFVFDDVSHTSMDTSIQFKTMSNTASASPNVTATLTNVGVWTDASDEGVKEYQGTIAEHRPDNGAILERIARLETGCYHAKDLPVDKTPQEYHAGPTAQQWWTEFGLGQDPDKHPPGIAPKDLAAVALAGIQEMIIQNEELKQRVAILEDKISED